MRCVQIALLYPSLFLLYFIGLGFTRLLMTPFARGTLHHPPPGGWSAKTFWRPAEGYELDQAGLSRQS